MADLNFRKSATTLFMNKYRLNMLYLKFYLYKKIRPNNPAGRKVMRHFKEVFHPLCLTTGKKFADLRLADWHT
jgi:hypothetical protein